MLSIALTRFDPPSHITDQDMLHIGTKISQNNHIFSNPPPPPPPQKLDLIRQVVVPIRCLSFISTTRFVTKCSNVKLSLPVSHTNKLISPSCFLSLIRLLQQLGLPQCHDRHTIQNLECLFERPVVEMRQNKAVLY